MYVCLHTSMKTYRLFIQLKRDPENLKARLPCIWHGTLFLIAPELLVGRVVFLNCFFLYQLQANKTSTRFMVGVLDPGPCVLVLLDFSSFRLLPY